MSMRAGVAVSHAPVDERLRLVADSVKDYAIFILDPSGRVATWTEGARRIKGYTPEEIIGRHFSVFYPPEDQQAKKPERELVGAAAEGRYEDEGWRVRKDGSRFWANVVITALHDPGGQLVGFVKVTRDLTERRRMEQELRETQESLSATLNSIGDAVLATDAAGCVVRMNPVAERLTGWTLAEARGRPFSEVFRIVHEVTRAPAEDPVARVLREGKAVALANHTAIIARDGSETPIADSAAPIRDAEGKLLGVVLVFRDVGEERQTAAALRRAAQAAEAANRELESFSYSVAHDLRAPLRAMSGFAEVLLEDYKEKLDADGVDCLLEVHNNAVRMGALIDALLSLSRVTRTPLRREPVDLGSLARGVVARLAAAEPGRAVETTIGDGLRAQLDPALARTLMENLLGNAWKFTGQSGTARIEVGAVQRDAERAFFVRDNGAGFDMAYANKLFSPFQRLHSTGEFPGTGIGLATVQRIVARHGGRVWAEGRPGEGAAFYFTVGEGT